MRSRDCSGAAASPRAPSRGRARGCATRRGRTASSSGGTCRSRRAAGSATSGTRGRRRRSQRATFMPPRLARPRRRARLQPLEPARLGRLGQARAGDQHVVAARAPRSSRLPRQASRSWRLSRLRVDRRAERLRHREPEPRIAASAPRERTSRGRGSGSRRSGRGGRRRRNRASARGGAGAASAGRVRRRGACGPRARRRFRMRLSGTRGHPRSETVPALSATDVRLISALQSLERWEPREAAGRRRGEYRRGLSTGSPQVARQSPESGLSAGAAHDPARVIPGTLKSVWRGVVACENPCKERPPGRHMVAATCEAGSGGLLCSRSFRRGGSRSRGVERPVELTVERAWNEVAESA